MKVTHTKVSLAGASPDPSKIGGDDWNSIHTVVPDYDANHIDERPSIPDPWDDEFDGETLGEAWVLKNGSAGGATCGVTMTGTSVILRDSAKVANQVRILAKPLPAGDFEVVCKVTNHGAWQYNNAGIGICDGDGNFFRGIRSVARNNNSPVYSVGWFTYENIVGITSPGEGNNVEGWPATVYLKLIRVGTTVSAHVSAHGLVWVRAIEWGSSTATHA